MKKLLLMLLLLSLSLVVRSSDVVNFSSDDPQEIIIVTETPPKKSLDITKASAFIFEEYIDVHVANYTGTVTCVVENMNGFATVTEVEQINISGSIDMYVGDLETGMYRLRVYIGDRIYSGLFTL